MVRDAVDNAVRGDIRMCCPHCGVVLFLSGQDIYAGGRLLPGLLQQAGLLARMRLRRALARLARPGTAEPGRHPDAIDGSRTGHEDPADASGT